MTIGRLSKTIRWRSHTTAGLLSGLFLVWSLPCFGNSLADDKYDHLFKANARAYMRGHDWRWLKAQSWQESRYDPAAVSPANARGIMQIMPGTGDDLARQTGRSGSLFDPALSILYGAVYMGQQLRFWHSPRPPLSRLRLAQASYNAGAGNILRAQRLSGGELHWERISPFLIRVTGRHSEETITYVIRIERWKDELDRIEGRVKSSWEAVQSSLDESNPGASVETDGCGGLYRVDD